MLPTPDSASLYPGYIGLIAMALCGIGSIINSWAIDSIANPHLNNDPGTIIAFPGLEILPLSQQQAGSNTG